MNEFANKLLVLGGLTNDRHTVFKFCEPAGTPRDLLLNDLLDGTYKKAFLIEEFEYRSMCFALDGCTQSEMRIDDPYALVNEYTRKMMGFLAFQPRPKQILIIGLGGGSLVKYCHRYLPTTRITAVEIDPVVLALRSQFLVPPDDDRLTVIQGDGADYVAQMVDRGEQINAILVDAYDHRGIANAVVERSFVENTKQILGPNGVFVMNLVAESADAKRHVETVRQVFGDAVVVAMQRGGNLVIFAGQTLHDPQRAGMAVRNAERVEDRLGLFFPTLIQHLNEVAGKLPLGARHVIKWPPVRLVGLRQGRTESRPLMMLPVLVFDPEPVAAGVLAMQLRHAGFETFVTSSGTAAIFSAGQKQFAAIVVIADLADSQMRHCLHGIRDADPEAWLIVISDPTLDGARRVIRELGVDARLDMPFTVSDLAQRLSVLPARAPPSSCSSCVTKQLRA